MKYILFNTFYFYQYAKLGVLLLFCIILSSIILLFSQYLTTKTPDLQKSSTYECGFEPYEGSQDLFDVRFYIVAIMFLIFDLEAVFFYPWCVSLGLINNEGFWVMADFLIELLVGFIYAWKVGALDWE